MKMLTAAKNLFVRFVKRYVEILQRYTVTYLIVSLVIDLLFLSILGKPMTPGAILYIDVFVIAPIMFVILERVFTWLEKRTENAYE